MKQKTILLLLLMVCLGVGFQPVAAQSYLFQVPREEVQLFIQEDGTASLKYVIEFINDPGGHEIDFVDLGLPNYRFDINTIHADIDGLPIAQITTSDYQGSGSGVALGLGDCAIPPGETGIVNVTVGKIERMIYAAETPENYASLQFSPNYFGGEFTRGITDLTVTIYLPPGMETEEPRWFPPSSEWPGVEEPESGIDEHGRVYYTWQAADANSHTEYIFGVAFPAHYVPETALQTGSEDAELGVIGVIVLLGLSCMFLLLIGLSFIFPLLPIPILMVVNRRLRIRRKMKYLPPKISIEGHGIKRGLTAVQAAVVMERPVDTVFSMILFSTIKKGAARIKQRNPLMLKVSDPFPEPLHSYERDFLETFQLKSDQRREALQDVMVKLVKGVFGLMKGFSLKETKVYYEAIVEKAWQQVETAETPEVLIESYDRSMGWVLMDKNFENRTQRAFHTRPVILPGWWSGFSPAVQGSAAGVPPAGTVSSARPSISKPQLPGADFAASIVHGIEGFSADVIGNVTNFTGKITEKTNPVPKSSSSSRGRSGGGGCACACACAGCACACAGGGR
jgi:hypothetical protein